MPYRKFSNKNVERIFSHYPEKVGDRLLQIRELIFDISEKNNEVGELEETLKWDSPSYLTSKPKSGTTIRLSGLLSLEYKYAISVHCQTTLISEFKEVFSDIEYEDNRSIILDIREKLPLEIIERFVYLALTYHHRKKLGIGV